MAYKTPDKFGKLLIVGVAAMFFFHIFENIGMTIGLMPITGIPLPFMSYGGIEHVDEHDLHRHRTECLLSKKPRSLYEQRRDPALNV